MAWQLEFLVVQVHEQGALACGMQGVGTHHFGLAASSLCVRMWAVCMQVREEEIEAENRERVQRRSSAMLASKANKFAAIHTERLKTFRQLAAAKVCHTGQCCPCSTRLPDR